MPNWCENEVTVTGPKEAMELFIKYNVNPETPEDFNMAISEPSTIEVGETFNWNKVKDHDESKDSQYMVEFWTRWEPPIYLFEGASPRYPELTFIIRYGEFNMDFSGKVTIKDGVILDEEKGQYGRYYGVDVSSE